MDGFAILVAAGLIVWAIINKRSQRRAVLCKRCRCPVAGAGDICDHCADYDL